MRLHLDDTKIRELLRLEDLLPALRLALIDLSAGRVFQPLRMVTDLPGDGFLMLKPAQTRDALVTKLITLKQGNAARGLDRAALGPICDNASRNETGATWFRRGLRSSAGHAEDQ